MRPARQTVFGGSSNFLYSSRAKSGGFFISTNPRLRTGLSTKKTVPQFAFVEPKMKDLLMKKSCQMLVSACVLASSVAHADLFSSIQDWVGTGDNEAAFEIDWNNGTANDDLVWGYRWNGTATGEQMLDALVAVDPRLYAEVSGTTPYGTELFGLGFHPSGDQNFTLNPPLAFNSQHLAYTDYGGVVDGRTAVVAGDQWQEGWYTAGYWAYYNSTDSRLSANPSDWDSASAGMTDRVLENGDVDGWDFSFYDGSGDSSPGVPVAVSAVPEPMAWPMLSLCGGLVACFCRNRRVKTTT